MAFPIEIMKMIQQATGASYPASVSTTLNSSSVSSTSYTPLNLADAPVIVTSDATGKLQAYLSASYEAAGLGTGLFGSASLVVAMEYRVAGSGGAFTTGPEVTGGAAEVDPTGTSTGPQSINYSGSVTAAANTSYEVRLSGRMDASSAEVSSLSISQYASRPTVYVGPVIDVAKTAPAYKSKTATAASSTAATTVAWPSGHAAGDFGILLIQTSNQAVPSTPAGWTAITNSGTGTAAASGSTRITAYYRFATSAAEAAVTISDTGDHQNAVILTYSGVNTTTPLEALVASGNGPTNTAQAAASTTGVCAAPVTYGANRRMVIVSGVGLPDAAGTAQFSGWTNGEMGAFTERFDQTWTAGLGGGIGAADAIAANPFSYSGISYSTSTSSKKGQIAFALIPA